MTKENEKNISENPETKTEEKDEKPKVRFGIGGLYGGSQFGGNRSANNYQNPNVRSNMRRAS